MLCHEDDCLCECEDEGEEIWKKFDAPITKSRDTGQVASNKMQRANTTESKAINIINFLFSRHDSILRIILQFIPYEVPRISLHCRRGFGILVAD